MKYIKLFEGFIKEDIDVFAEEWDLDDEEFYDQEKSHWDIPGMPKGYDEKDHMRITNLINRSNNMEHLIRLAKTMANRITHIDKAIRRGNAVSKGTALPEPVRSEFAKVFYDRAKKLYFGE